MAIDCEEGILERKIPIENLSKFAQEWIQKKPSTKIVTCGTDYQNLAITQLTKLKIPKEFEAFFHAVGMAEECGELAGVVKEDPSNNASSIEITAEKREEVISEAGDLCWYLALWCSCHGIDFGLCLTRSSQRAENNPDEKFRLRSFWEVHETLGELLGRQKRMGAGKTFEQSMLEGLVTKLLRVLHDFLIGHYGCRLGEVLGKNQVKIEDRQKRNVIMGEGNHR